MPTENSDSSGSSTVSGIKNVIASFTGGKNNNNLINQNNQNNNQNNQNNNQKYGGVANIYFSNRNNNTITDQYLTIKPKLPSRVSSDPIRVYKQSSEKLIEEHKGKAWSNDILSKALKSWPTGNDKPLLIPGNTPDSEKSVSVRLYDFSSTPTGISAGSDGAMKSPPRGSQGQGQGQGQGRHTSGPGGTGSDSPSRGSVGDGSLALSSSHGKRSYAIGTGIGSGTGSGSRSRSGTGSGSGSSSTGSGGSDRSGSG